MRNPKQPPQQEVSEEDMLAFCKAMYEFFDLVERLEKMPPSMKAAIIRQFTPEVKHLL